MRSQIIWKLLPLFVLLFIAIGDLVLPKPLSNYSRLTRTTINRRLISIFPHPELEQPYDKNEEIIKKVEQK